MDFIFISINNYEFISKFYIMLAAAEQQNLLVMAALAISTVFTAIYMVKMLVFIYRPTTDEFKPHLKLNAYFDEESKNKHSYGDINSKHIAERKLPFFMLMSITLCVCGVIFFMFIQQVINKFLMFI